MFHFVRVFSFWNLWYDDIRMWANIRKPRNIEYSSLRIIIRICSLEHNYGTLTWFFCSTSCSAGLSAHSSAAAVTLTFIELVDCSIMRFFPSSSTRSTLTFALAGRCSVVSAFESDAKPIHCSVLALALYFIAEFFGIFHSFIHSFITS